MSVKERYEKDFGTRNYESAVHALWESKCAGHIPNWPPTLEQVEKKCEELDQADLYANEKR